MFKKVLACFFSVLTFSLIFASSTNALTMSVLEPEYAINSKIEFNTPTDGNTFDVTFLAKNQNLTFKTAITNDQEDTIEITQIDFNDSTYDFLEYSYDGIAIGDELAPGESKYLTFKISSNNQQTRTIAEDYKFTIHYHKVEIVVPDTNDETTIPDTGANSIKDDVSAKSNNQLVYILTILGASVVLLVLLIASKKVKTSYAIIAVLSLATTFVTLSHLAIAENDQVYTISGKVRFTNVYSLSVDPGQGLYNGQAGIATFEHRDGEVINIEKPTYESYRFTGWTKTTLDPITGEPAESEPFAGGPLTTDQSYILTANWEEIYYNISINPNGGEYEGSSDIHTASVRYGEELPVSTPTYNTYSFTGWTKVYTDEETGETISEPFTGSTITASADYTLTANWEEIYYDFTIDPNGGEYEGSTDVTTIPFRAGATATLSDPVKEGTTFTGWTKVTINEETGETISEPLVGNSFVMEENTTLIANYEDLYFDITINPNGGTYTGETSLHVKYGTEITLPNPTYYTYGFTGWTINPTATLETTESGYKLVVKNNHTLTANWEELYFNLTINPNGGKYNNSTAVFNDTLRAGTTVTLLTASKEGSTFVDWTKNGISTTETSFVIEEDTTLIANYTDNYYDVIINPNGGTYTGETSVNVKHGTDITINNPTRDTYRFTGWTITPETTLEDTTDGKILHVNQPYTLTANWEEIRYNLTINPNGGTYEDSTEIQTAPYHVGTTVTIALPGKTGANFTGWTKIVEDPETGNTTTEAFTGTSLTISGNTTLTANYEDIYFDVTVNPNGGKFHNSTAVYTDSIKYGEYLDLTSIARDGYDLREWALNENDTLPYNTESIQILSNTFLTARWWSTTTYTVTLNPNGGKYNDSTSNFTATVRDGEDYAITGTPTRDDYRFEGWLKEDNTALTSNTFTVDGDITLHAAWFLLAVRNERTGTYYETLTTAEAEAESGDTLTVLVDLTEKFINSKNITLDLNGHTITGFMINNGEITLLNGEFNNYNAESTAGLITDEANPNGAAVINNGKLTLGIDDYEDNEDHVKSALVNNNYVRLIGSGMGIKQNGELYYYDGFIEGDIALEGGYNDSPWYRDTFDGVVVRHFPFVDRNNIKDCQHIALENSDRAVTKTVDNGEIYYYNLQDNINTSVRTGYKIYAVRDFDASYAINVPASTDVTFNIIGKTITINDTITIDGKFTVEDSSTLVLTTANAEGVNGNLLMPEVTGTTITTPHETTTTVATYGGIIQVPQTIINNGEFVIKNARVTGTTANDTIQNYGTLTMEAGILGATTGYVTQLNETGIYNLDNKSHLFSSSANNAVIYSSLDDVTWENEGNITGKKYGIQIHGYKKIKLNNCTIYAEQMAVYGEVHAEIEINGAIIKGRQSGIGGGSQYDSVVFNTGKIVVINPNGSASGSYANLVMNGGEIIVSGTERSIGVEVFSGSITINNGKITVYSNSNNNNNSVNGVYVNSSASMTINNGNIEAISTGNGTVYGINIDGYSSSQSSSAYINGGQIKSVSSKGVSYGIYGDASTKNIEINGGIVEAESTENNAYGINHNGFGNYLITTGRIKGTTNGIYLTNSRQLTIGINDENLSITSPEIIGGQYAIYDSNNNGYVNFYDGILRGGEKAYTDGVIKAIPDSTTYHIESSADYTENCWLEEAENYLSVDDIEYNSLTKAYAAIEGDTGTIKVIADATVEAVLPESPTDKTITIDLNGHQLTYSQTLINNSNMIIIDSSEEKTGKLNNNNPSMSTIENRNTLTVNSGYLSSAYHTITNTQDSTLNVNGGTIISKMASIYSNANSTANITGGLITLANDNTSAAYCINGYYANITVTGGQIKVERESNNAYDVYGIANNSSSGTVNINTPAGQTPILIKNNNGGATGITGDAAATITSGNITVESSNGSAEGVRAPLTLNGGNISVSGARTLMGVYTWGNSINLNSGTITVNKIGDNNSAVYGVFLSTGTSVNVNGGTVEVNGNKASTYGIYIDGYDVSSWGYVSINVSGGLVKSSTTTGTSYGIGGRSYIKRLNITGGTIESSSTEGSSYGMYGSGGSDVNLITGGKLQGGNYGIYLTNSRQLTIGINDENLSITSPEIIGGQYAIYDSNNNGYVNFYDGILRGGEKAYTDGVIKAIADNTFIHNEKQTIGEGESTKEYDTYYLEEEHYVAKINDTQYKKLSDAISYANENDTIELLEDNYLFYPLVIEADKDFTIETNGYNIITGNTITNNGKVKIINSSVIPSPVFIYSNSAYYITNNQNAELELNNIKIEAPYAIDNKGTLSLIKTEIESTNTAIKNTGTMTTRNNILLSGSTYPIYNDGGNATIADATLIGDSIYNKSGTLTLRNGNARKNGSEIEEFVTNNDTMILDAFEVSLTNTSFYYSSYSTYYSRALYNKGTLDIINNSKVEHTVGTPSTNFSADYTMSLQNDGGTVHISNSSIILDGSNAQNTQTSYYGIYSPTGTVTIESGSVYTNSKRNAYGIWNNTGTIIIGIAEPTTSPNYGRDTADVSTTSPDIKAIGTSTGIGVKNNTGKIYYYDGKITGSTAAMPEIPAGIEYLYEPKDEVDANGYHVRTLEWMREQPGL